MDLRTNHDEKADIIGGVLYRKGAVIRACWDKEHGHDTWTLPEESEAKETFNDMKVRYNEKDT